MLYVGLQTTNRITGGVLMGTENSLAHTKWECKYHIVFAPKYRRQVIYKKIKADVGQIQRMLCRRKGIEIIEAEASPKDKIWGIGLDAQTAASTDMSEWPGQGLLGLALMELRKEFSGEATQ